MSIISQEIVQQLEQRFGIVGDSIPMLQAMSRLVQVAPTDLTALITGETGTGKEIFAQALHALSARKRFPFVSVNCGAIPETLLESELFGAEKGAYTGADEKRKGFFEAADRGTIFLDEIGEMPIGTQVKLLRILESGEFSRLGSSSVQRVDTRIIAATNRDLLFEVKQGRFRQDLYFRLNSVNIHLPPLRQHPTDIPLLVEYFATKTADKNGFVYQGIDEQALSQLEALPWHGNVRELRNMIETIVTLERGARITTRTIAPYILPESVTEPHPQALMRLTDVYPPFDPNETTMLYRSVLQLTAEVYEMKNAIHHLLNVNNRMQDQVITNGDAKLITGDSDQVMEFDELNLAKIERLAIEAALRKTHGRRREAAQLLGISERTLYRKIDEYSLS
ncbi:MAG: sigma-54-dependent Fis family transcriptional regulator [Chlorobi bacterium]|nr:MAG: sigma-54-dependent Fis family transcriptional regulator [Bacteroidota bacterium]KXK35740.1 MAG: response regulator [Chlorobi bacterium OLB6]MBE2265298.1 sigma-54-dependent Fis family transcriptional regulator [Flavobacteriales bacterium]MBL1160239.1 sigma-54-dependent Fis family transcriptional regulator [Chlorobiota bacterium]MBW7853377.1 sigma-54-dependent Fis family transcriptional regulator [Candidatus Kapabacteria bacterium]MCC6330424.1 sigma-54-dependent Fis family transcriptiona